VVTYNVLATAKAALAKVHGADTIEREFSDYYLAAELDAVAAGMAVALPAQDWQVFRTLPLTEFVAFLFSLAHNVRFEPSTPLVPRTFTRRLRTKGKDIPVLKLLLSTSTISWSLSDCQGNYLYSNSLGNKLYTNPFGNSQYSWHCGCSH
jgi:hypothetical protein